MPITRHFINWNQPVLPATADYVIDRYATSDELNLQNLVLVFTGRRASRRMLELLVEKAADRWPAFLPPRMVTFQYFPEMLYPQQKKAADDLTQLLVWKKAIGLIKPAELQAALPNIPDDDAVPSWFSLCESLRSQHNELAEEGMDFDAIHRAHAEIGNKSEAKRWKSLRRIQAEYLMQMDELDLWDRETSRLYAVEQNECVADFDVILVGTVDLSKVVRPMLDQVADRVTVVIHAPETVADSFDQYGCLNPDQWADRPLNIPTEATRIANSPDEQADIVVNEIAAFDGCFRADEISVGIADDSLVPSVLQKFSDAGVEGRWPVGMQLRDTRPWRLLNGIVDHLATARDGQPPDFSSLSDLVRHPDVSEWIENCVQQTQPAGKEGKIDWLTALDHYRAGHLQRNPGVLLGSRDRRRTVGAVIEGVDSLLSLLCPDDLQPAPDALAQTDSGRQRQLTFDSQFDVVSLSTQRQLESRRPLTVWATGLLRLLSAVYGKQTLDSARKRDRGIIDCCTAFNDVAESLSHIPEAVMPVSTASQAIQLLLRQVAAVTVPPDSSDDAIDLLGWLELAMDDAPVLILTGFNEGFVPESMTSDIFLPNGFRSHLGLKDNRRRYARDAYALTAILSSREKTILVSGRADAQGNPLTPSRLWFAAEQETLPDRVQQFYDADSFSTAESQIPTSQSEIVSPPSASPVSGFTVPRPFRLPAAPTEIAVTAFREYLDCPYRYLLRRELKLRPVEDETMELSAPTFGSLIHDVLNSFGQSDYAHSTNAEPIEDFLLKTLQSLTRRKFGRNRTATVSVQLQMVQNRLSAFAQWQARTAAEGWRIRFTEEDLKHPEFKDARGRPVVLAGRVDRIDQHQTSGQWRVLDYKTSERAERPESTHLKKQQWVDLQLPLYRLLIQSLGIDGDVQLGYVHLPGDLSSVGASIAKWTDSDLKAAEDVARRVAADIIDLKIDRVAPGQEFRNTEFARVCQDSVLDRNIPWLDEWTGRKN